MILSQSSAQWPSLSGGAETGTKRIVNSKGSALPGTRPRSQLGRNLSLLKKNPTDENIGFYLKPCGGI